MSAGFAAGLAAGLVSGQFLASLQPSGLDAEKPDYTYRGNAVCLPPGFDPPDTFEKHEAAYRQLKEVLVQFEQKEKPKKSFWQWIWG